MSLMGQALADPDKPATIMAGSNIIMSFGELAEITERLAALLRTRLDIGERVALLCLNDPYYLAAAWACRRAGLRFVPINWHLTFDEVRYVTQDSNARALVASAALGEIASRLPKAAPDLELLLTLGGVIENFVPLEDALRSAPERPLEDRTDGIYMFYSSGTTGRPKGILRPLPEAPFGTPTPMEVVLSSIYSVSESSILLTPAPLYHGAPMGWSLAAQGLGATVLVMERFDPELMLATVERYHVTHIQCVPIHFVRMLRLPVETRARYDLSSLECVVHAAAPCPPDVKRAMIEWVGPIVSEYYSATEGAGFTHVDSETWLKRPGTVGKPIIGGAPHILNDAGDELPPNEIGLVYFEDTPTFHYHGDEEKTASFFNERGWGCNGDMGWLDEEGFLFLADRKSHMIISGGVNIYPQEVEDHLLGHPFVADAAVIGVPNAEHGEEVKAVVQLQPNGPPPTESVAAELISFCRKSLAGFKCPRSVDFVEELPRLPNGKLLKRELRKVYWGEGNVLI